MKVCFKVYRQFLVCQDLPLDNLPVDYRWPTTKIKEFEHELSVKNGNEAHDKAVEQFNTQEICLKATYFCKSEHFTAQKHIKLPYGTVVV